MARRIPEQELEAILAAVARRPGEVTARDIAEDLGDEIPFRTLQYRIKSLVDDGRLVRDDEGRWATYNVPSAEERPSEEEGEPAVPVSAAGAEIRGYVQEPAAARKPVGYDRAFLDSDRVPTPDSIVLSGDGVTR